MSITSYTRQILDNQARDGLTPVEIVYLLNRHTHGPQDKRFFSEKMGLSMRQIQRVIQSLKKKGFIR